MAEVLKFSGITRIPDDPVVALEKAKAWGLERVVIAGWSKDGEFIFGGSHSEISDTLLILEIARKRLMEAADKEL